MRKFFIIITGLFFSFLFTACRQYTVDIEEYLSYWASEPYVKDHTVKTVHHNDGESILCVPSASNITVTLTLYNPKHFPFVMPTPKDADNTENNKNIIHFPGLDKQPQCGTDYTLQQTAPETLQLVYKSAFLQTHEWGNGDIGPEIILKAQDGRPFKQKYSFKIRANTSPQKPNFTVAKTKGSPAYYVLCIAARDMDQKVPGGLVHKDLTRIEINGTPYGLSINEGQTAFIKPEAGVFIAHSEVEKLSDPNADDILSGGWVLYYKTDAEVKEGAAKKDYTLRLADAKGLVSEDLNASTKPNRPESETLTITKGTESGSASGSASDPKIIGADGTGAELKVSSATGNTLVHCTLTDMGSGAAAEYTGNPVSVPLALNGEGAKTYKLDYYTDGEGFTATPVKTVYYTVLQKYTVTFDAQQGTPVPPQQFVLHGDKVSKPASPARTGYTFGEWYKDAACSGGQEWNFTTDMVISNITLYAKWIPGTGTGYTIKHYQQNLDGTYPNPTAVPPPPPEDTEPKTGVMGGTLSFPSGAAGLKNYPGFTYDSSLTKINGTVGTSGTIKPDGTTVVELYYERKTVTVTFNPDGGTISGGTPNLIVSGRYGTTLTIPTPAKTGYHLNPAGEWEPVSPAVSLGSSPYTFPAADGTYKANWTANTYIVSFHKNDGSSTTANQNFTYGTSNNLTANTFTRTGYTFDGWAENSGGSGTQYADGQSVNNLTTVQGGTVSLYAKWTANTYTVRFNGNGNTGGTAMGNRTFTYDATENLPSNTFTKTGYTFGGWARSSGITTVVRTDGAPANNLAESGTVDLYAVWYKNPTVTFKVEGGTGGSLKGTYGGIPKTAGGTTEQSFTVTYGGSINFETTPTYAWEVEHWTGLTASPANAATVTFSDITQDTIVKVKFKKTTTVKSTDPQPWKLLKEVIKIADNNAVITINGEIEATSGDNAGELKTYLPSSGRLTIQGGTTDAALNAKSQNRIFKIDNDNTLNLKNLTLKNGKASGSGENANGGALYIGPNVPTINLTQVTLTDNTASGNGGAIYIDNARVNLTKVTLTNNTANGDGGAIYNTRCELKIKGSTIENNTAANYGGSIYTKHATITIIDNEGTQKTAIKLNKAKYGAGLCYINCANNEIKGNTEITENGNNTVTEEGGAIYMSSTVASAVRVSISGNTKITNCKAKKGGAVYMTGDISFFIRGNTEIKNCTANAGGGAYVHSIGTSGWGFNIEKAAKFTVSTGGDANKIGKNDVYLNSGCMISASSLTTGNGQAARISIDSGAYSTGTKVLDRGVDAHKKFIVTPRTGSGSNWYVGSDGKLTQTKPW